MKMKATKENIDKLPELDTRALAKYLADYVQKEFEDNFEIVGGNPTNDDWKAWTMAGIEAFCSTENVGIN
jgi:hypothetical protein